MAGPAAPSMGPCGAHHASGNTLARELPVVASCAQVSSSSAINALALSSVSRTDEKCLGSPEMPGGLGGEKESSGG